MSIETPVVIIGAGPSGLFQVFELGLLGIRAHIVDSLPAVGGQCTALYPDKPIYDIPALPVVGAQELVDRLQEQIAPFSPTYHLKQEVIALERRGGDQFYLQTSKGVEFITDAVVIAGGLGSFRPRPLRLAGIEKYEGGTLNYKVTDRNKYRNKRVVVLGGGDSALDWALELSAIAQSVTVVHRRDDYRGAAATAMRLRQLAAKPGANVSLRTGRVKGFVEVDGVLSGIQIDIGDGVLEQTELDELLVFYGLSPDLGPIAHFGLEIDKRYIAVTTENFETSTSGVFAVGDVNTYPGKKKLILSGFHEAALAAYGIQQRLFPGQKQFVQYTTTSPIMHKRLGLEDRKAS
ncbi:MAG: ferredoxin--NADP(+) reductase [Thiotrichales bacterium]|nr:ferredoxin--NADP(+) reductase [Thiotrichales bacterium]